VIVVILLVILPGCIPIAMLPSEHRVAGGMMAGRFRDGELEPTQDGVGAQFQYRGSVAPLAMVPELWDRDFDFDLGYVVSAHERGTLQHGPSAALSYFAVRESLDGRAACATTSEGFVPGDCAPPGFHNLFRLAVRAELDVRFTDSERSPGVGGRLGLRFDFSWLPESAEPVVSSSTSSDGSTSIFAGALWGEGGIAIDLLLGGGAIAAQGYFDLLVALTFRIPAIAGILIVIP
jgi:hypothetical protein